MSTYINVQPKLKKLQYSQRSLVINNELDPINEPHIVLRLEVLNQAIKDLAIDGRDYRTAKVWVETRGYEDEDFSFDNLCRTIDYNPNYVRRKVYEMAGQLRVKKAEEKRIRDLNKQKRKKERAKQAESLEGVITRKSNL